MCHRPRSRVRLARRRGLPGARGLHRGLLHCGTRRRALAAASTEGARERHGRDRGRRIAVVLPLRFDPPEGAVGARSPLARGGVERRVRRGTGPVGRVGSAESPGSVDRPPGPADSWSWEKGIPDDWRPQVAVGSDGTSVTFYTHTMFDGERLTRHVDRFEAEGYRLRTRERCARVWDGLRGSLRRRRAGGSPTIQERGCYGVLAEDRRQQSEAVCSQRLEVSSREVAGVPKR